MTHQQGMPWNKVEDMIMERYGGSKMFSCQEQEKRCPRVVLRSSL